MIFGMVFLFLLFGALCASLQTPLYSATAIVRLFPVAYDIQTREAVTDDLPSYSVLRAEQIRILRSEDVIAPLITKWDLTHRQEFDQNRDIRAQILSALTIGENAPFDFRITYVSPSPYLARALANSIAENYRRAALPEGRRDFVSKASLPDTFFIPRAFEILLFFAILGFALGCLFSIKLGLYSGPGERVS